MAFSMIRSGRVARTSAYEVRLSRREAGVAVDGRLRRLVAGHRHLTGVDDDDEVTGVEVRRVVRLVLAAQQLRRLAGQPARARRPSRR
jgi:hypothetical protein